MICTIARVTVIAVNIEQIIPIINVTAKPLIGPVPIANRMNATRNVVKFESKWCYRLDHNRPQWPVWVRPPEHFFSDTLTYQYVRIDRHTNGNNDTGNTR